MTIEDLSSRIEPGPEPTRDPRIVERHPMQQDSDHDYRALEQSYRQSQQYAAMQARYPQLRHWLSVCRHGDLVGDSASASAWPPPVVLQWDRSHGEG